MTCWSCEGPVPEGGAFCPGCGHSMSDRSSSPIFVVDATTELFNGVFLRAIVEQEANRAVRYRRPLSVLVVEIDHAQHINGDLGQAQIHSLLKELAEAVVLGVRDTDTVGFLGPEGPPRFGIVLPETDSAEAVQVADKLRASIASNDFQAGGSWQRLTVSVGAATVNHERIGHQDLLEEAHRALAAGLSAGSGPNRTHVPAHAG